ncbi:MAG: phenylacetate--CoA ligase family protein [Candidatus Heimdallarchaeota archaeon]
MSFRKFTVRHFLYPVADLVRGTNFISYYRFLRKSQWWDEEKIAKFQTMKLRKIINHSYTNVPYYRRLFNSNNIKPDDIKTKKDLLKIPPLTKADLRKYLMNDLLATNIPIKRRTPGRTGGSTGEPIQFFRDKKESQSWAAAANFRAMEWAGLKLGEKYFVFAGGSLGGFLPSKPSKRNRLKDYIVGSINFPSFEMSEEKLKKHVSEMKRNDKVHFLRGYPSALFILSKYLIENDLIIENITAISTTAEKLYDYQRNEIEKAFQCTVYDQYGCGEINSLAAQCEKSDLYHVADEHVIVETKSLDKKLNIARITDLDNYVNPLIRFENGDALRISNRKCDCTRSLSTIESIEGRTHDFIVTTTGDLLAGEFFPHLFQSIKGIDQYFILQKSITELIVQLKPNEMFSQVEVDEHIAKIQEYVGKTMNIEVILKDEIPLTKSGKRLFIKSNVKLDSFYK